MIEINGIKYYSEYKPADKRFFKSLAKADCTIHNISFNEKDWNTKWDLDYKLREAQDILKQHPELKKELNLIISECQYELFQFSDDEDIVNAYKELVCK